MDEIIWLPHSLQYFQMHFVEWKSLHFYVTSVEICFQGLLHNISTSDLVMACSLYLNHCWPSYMIPNINNINMLSYQYRHSHYKDKTVSQLSYLYMEIPIPSEQSIYWDEAQATMANWISTCNFYMNHKIYGCNLYHSTINPCILSACACDLVIYHRTNNDLPV